MSRQQAVVQGSVVTNYSNYLNITIRYSVFDHFQKPNVFSIQTFLKNRIYSVFGLF